MHRRHVQRYSLSTKVSIGSNVCTVAQHPFKKLKIVGKFLKSVTRKKIAEKNYRKLKHINASEGEQKKNSK